MSADDKKEPKAARGPVLPSAIARRYGASAPAPTDGADTVTIERQLTAGRATAAAPGTGGGSSGVPPNLGPPDEFWRAATALCKALTRIAELAVAAEEEDAAAERKATRKAARKPPPPPPEALRKR
jgi:hypothetical protein